MPIRCPGSRLKRIRKEVLTQQQAAKLVGVTRLTIRRWMGFFETTPVRQRGWCAPRMVLTRDLIEFMDRTKRVDWDI